IGNILYDNINVRFVRPDKGGHTIQIDQDGGDNFNNNTNIVFRNLRADVVNLSETNYVPLQISNSTFILGNNTNVFNSNACSRLQLNGITLDKNGFSGNLGCNQTS